ncbi:MAG: hypothetical protein N3G21_00515, partial [Candidatus Hydrogenedentes bacterium]|nr:hypothetical protein [Candidatus Hydrogenedentota bacterium]
MNCLLEILLAVTILTQENDFNSNALNTQYSGFTQIYPKDFWEKESLLLAKRLPIQSEGRVKPWNTYARFLLLRFSGRTSVRLSDGSKITPIQWLLDTLFFPEISYSYPVFIVHDEVVLESLGLKTHGKKRDRYSYRELIPIRDKLISQYLTLRNIPPQKRSYIQDQTVILAENILSYEEIINYLEFANKKIFIPPGASFSNLYPSSSVSLVELIKTFPKIKKSLKEESQKLSPDESQKDLSAIKEILKQVSELVRSAEHFAILPPRQNASDLWDSPIGNVIDVFDPEKDTLPDTNILELFYELQNSKTDKAKFNSTFITLSQRILEKSQNYKEYKKIPLEVSYYDLNLLFYSQWIFFLAVILTAIWWLFITNKILKFSVYLTNSIGLMFLISAITLRCIIRERPPVTTLYETILFSTMVAVALSLIVEKFHREGILLSVTSFLGLLGV